MQKGRRDRRDKSERSGKKGKEKRVNQNHKQKRGSSLNLKLR
jgi:hypothetical protein